MSPKKECYVPPPINPPKTTDKTPIKQGLNSVVSYCYDAVDDLSQLRPDKEQKQTIDQFKNFVGKQGSQIVTKIAPRNVPVSNTAPAAGNPIVAADVYSLGNSCKNIYGPFRERITKGKCYK